MASNKSVFIFAVSLDEINCFPLYSGKEPKDKSVSNTLERQETGQLQKSDKFGNASVIKQKRYCGKVLTSKSSIENTNWEKLNCNIRNYIVNQLLIGGAVGRAGVDISGITETVVLFMD